MTPAELDAFAKRAVQMRGDLALMRAAFTSRKFIRSLSKKQARARLNELFDVIDDLVNGAVGLVEMGAIGEAAGRAQRVDLLKVVL